MSRARQLLEADKDSELFYLQKSADKEGKKLYRVFWDGYGWGAKSIGIDAVAVTREQADGIMKDWRTWAKLIPKK